MVSQFLIYENAGNRKKTNLRTRIAVVRLVIEGKMSKKAAKACNVHHQSVSECVKWFSEGGLDLLLERKTAPGCEYFLSDSQ
ncbi:helix-turn-helix domain-containing protein [Ectobacillus antri]|uniref:helix-turn-helix domain-containing protein n=1 Tax=Ectobacillus antri TaxID=2486280 RepID=UPI000F590F10